MQKNLRKTFFFQEMRSLGQKKISKVFFFAIENSDT